MDIWGVQIECEWY